MWCDIYWDCYWRFLLSHVHTHMYIITCTHRDTLIQQVSQNSRTGLPTFKWHSNFTNYAFDVFFFLGGGGEGGVLLAHTNTRKAFKKIAKLKLRKYWVGCLHPIWSLLCTVCASEDCHSYIITFLRICYCYHRKMKLQNFFLCKEQHWNWR